MDSTDAIRTWFSVFTEIGIINQLSTTLFNRHMPLGLHISHFSVINHLYRLGDGRTPQEIARAFQVTKPTMTHTLAKLSALQFVEIHPNPADKRSKCVFLTTAGRNFQEQAIMALRPLLDRLAHDLDVTTATNILPELQELRAYLDKNREETNNDATG